MNDKEAQALYRTILRAGPPDDADPHLGRTARDTVDKLKSVRRVYRMRFSEACEGDDADLADAIDMVLRRIGVMLFSIGQAIQRHIDGAPDNVAAVSALEAIQNKLDAAAEHAARASDDVERTAAVLDGLAGLVGWVN